MLITGVIASDGLLPGTPTIGTATAGNTQASVAFTTPSYTGKGGTVTYRAISSPGNFQATSTSSPIVVTGLSNGTAYTFTVRTETSYGVNSPFSAASNSVTPVNPVVNYFSLVNSPNATYGIFEGATTNSTANYYAGTTELETPSTVPVTIWSYNKTGGVNWSRKLVSTTFSDQLIAPRLAVGPNGNIIVVARIFNGNAGTQRAYMASINPTNGSFNWQQTYTSDNSNTFSQSSHNVYVDANNDIYVSGRMASQARLFKFNSSGNILWSRRNYQAAGNGSRDAVWGNGTNLVYTCATEEFAAGKDAFPNGVITYWTFDGTSGARRRIGGTDNANRFTPQILTVDSNSSVFVAGIRQNPNAFAAIFKMNSSLEVLANVHVNNNFTFSAITRDSSNAIYAAGGSANVLNIFKFDNNLNVLWQRTLASSSGLTAFGGNIQIAFDTTNNKLIVAGLTFNDGVAIALPSDGSGTGTYTFAGGKALTYSVQTFTVNSQNINQVGTTIGASTNNATRTATSFNNNDIVRTVSTITF